MSAWWKDANGVHTRANPTAFIIVAVLLSQLMEWNLQGKIDCDQLIEGR
jgi:hypothetical protein